MHPPVIDKVNISFRLLFQAQILLHLRSKMVHQQVLLDGLERISSLSYENETGWGNVEWFISFKDFFRQGVYRRSEYKTDQFGIELFHDIRWHNKQSEQD